MRWLISGRRFLIGLLSMTLLGIALVIAVVTYRGRSLEASDRADSATPAATPSSSAMAIELSPGKREAAGLQIEAARAIDMPVEVVVPGQIEPNVDRQVQIRTRVPGIIRSVAVVLGQKVKAGETLLMLDSADVATARLNLRSRQRELTTARMEAEWHSEVATNVDALIPALRKNTDTRVIEKQFAAKPLGNDRALLLSAYADWQIAQHEEEKQTDLYQKRIVGEHVAVLAEHTREGSQAKFEAALEQVRYDAGRLKRLADQQVRLAESSVIDAGERLRILGVPVDLNDSVAHPEQALANPSGDPLTAYPIVAPFDGTITTRAAVPSQRVELTDVLLTLVDLSSVRVMANISESDFAVLPKLHNATVRVTAAAYPERVFRAKVLNLGAQVEPTTRTVTLLAETANPDDLLKLGMFVRMAIDSAKSERATTVPAGAVIEIDGRPVVFVPDDDGRTFVVRPVTLGREIEGRLAIMTGLSPGDRVVSVGAFMLKSELILSNEDEEE